MANIILENDSIFSITETNLFGKRTEGTISSYHFILEGIEKLDKVKNDESFKEHIYEYSAILKALIKNEILEEMRKRIDNIDTFYR